ncbi:ATP-binding protein [Candidatus Kuenenia sp.]|uniref:two-component system histidine kinase PnpS n=1 Tax=Candidatus Kuenenia sp. TaxID=2499824 RepID=UPI00322061A8
MLKHKPVFKTCLLLFLLLSVCFLPAFYYVHRTLKSHHVALLNENILSKSSAVYRSLEKVLPGNNREKIISASEDIGNLLKVGIVITDAAGGIAYAFLNKNIPEAFTEDNVVAYLRKGSNNNIFHDESLQVSLISVSIGIPDVGIKSLVVISPLEHAHAAISSVSKKIAVCLLIFFAVSAAIGFIIIERILSPVAEITRIVKNFLRGDFTTRADISSRNGTKELAKAVNTMGNRLQTQQQIISDSEKRLTAIINNMKDAIMVVDLQERILLINNMAKTFFGIAEISPGRDYLWERIRNETLQILVKQIMKTNAGFTTEIEYASPKKKLLQTQFSLLQKDNNTIGILIVFHDITDLRKLENTRKEFVANVSHELRTPLTSIKGYVETLLENHTADGGHTYNSLKVIMKHTQRLDNLIKDILELSKLETNELKTELHELNLYACIEDILHTYKEHCKEKKQSFRPHISQNLPTVESNEYLLRQLLTNLLDNAIKYTHVGGDVGLSISPAEETIQIEVSDTGIGIPHEHIPRIFERFYRIDPARSREMGGTGLGLSIVKHIVNLHNGAIKLKSTVGKGSTFTVILPQKQQKPSAAFDGK